MTRAVLTMDMPEQCQECVLCCETSNSGYMCCATGKSVPYGEKPDFCPLRELPDYKRTVGTEIENDKLLMNMGWNSCLDEITG